MRDRCLFPVSTQQSCSSESTTVVEPLPSRLCHHDDRLDKRTSCRQGHQMRECFYVTFYRAWTNNWNVWTNRLFSQLHFDVKLTGVFKNINDGCIPVRGGPDNTFALLTCFNYFYSETVLKHTTNLLHMLIWYCLSAKEETRTTWHLIWTATVSWERILVLLEIYF